MMARRGWIAVLILLLSALAPARAVERILLFVSDVQVEPNSDLIVTETIRVQAEGREIRHGIRRDFPTSYRRRDGTPVEVGFEVEKVMRDGASEPYTVEGLGNGVRVQIGRAEAYVPLGPHEYSIRYRTTRQVGFFTEFDELYWNATGNGWTLPIEVAEARITLPEPVPFRQTAFYTGPQGARGSDAAVVENRAGHIVFRTTRPLPAANGLSVAAAWPKGVVTPPNSARLAGWWLHDNVTPVVAAAGLALMLGYYAYAWFRVGRDPQRGTVVPLFGPPEGMSAAAVRYVRRMGFDNRAYTAAMLELAVGGHLKIVELAKRKMRIDHLDRGRPVGRAEQAMESRLFAGTKSLALDDDNYKTLREARTALDETLSASYAGKLFRNHFNWSGWGLLASAGVVAVIIFVIFADHMQGADLAWTEIVAALVPVIVLGLAFSAFYFLKAHTVEGRKVVDQIEGFRQYLSVAEEDRLEALNPPQKTPELFERFLPYAVALDVENSWGRRFVGVLATAAAGHAVATSWYSGSYDVTADPAGFADHLGSSFSQTIAAAATPPGSSDGGSGSGGGGSSGGGGGGGGGSGW
jgi:hypothetical protein